MNETESNIIIIKDYEKLKNNILHYDKCFIPSLSEQVDDIERYINKLYEKAISCEILNKSKERMGMISFYSNDKENNVAFITMIVVEMEHLKKGIGSTLIKYAEEYAKKKDMKRMKLEVQKSNSKAIVFYKKNGYEIIQDNKNTYYMIKEL